jgi:hypothetical protein
MTILTTLLLTLCLSTQDPTEIEFFFNGKFYTFTLPNSNYKADTTKYVEGTFLYFNHDNHEQIVLHVGDNVLKPFLKEGEYVVTDKFENWDISTRRGYNRTTKLHWQEDTIANGQITLYFRNVKKENLKSFEDCLKSLHVKSVIRELKN